MKILSLPYVALLIGLTSIASAQVTTVASDTFEYPVPGLFHDMVGGTGWSNNWFVTGGGNEDMVMFDSTIMPAFAASDGVGGYAGQANPFGAAFRQFDLTANPELVDPAVNMLGADGNTIWVSFSTVNFQGMPQEHYGGLSLWKAGAPDPEALFLGSPWNTMGWGLDDQGGAGAPEVVVPGSDDSVAARLVYRIDFMPGDERLRLYINPATPYPTCAADLDLSIADLRFDEIRISSGGNNGDAYFFDDIVFAKGVPEIGAQLCAPGANSTGSSSTLAAFGSGAAADNDFSLCVGSLPPSSMGLIIASPGTVFVANPGGGTGSLCVGPMIGRAVGGAFMSDATGAATVTADLSMIPTPTGFDALTTGDTRNFQVWHRDVDSMGMPTSHFGDAISVVFQ